jgi:hypothetical protein
MRVALSRLLSLLATIVFGNSQAMADSYRITCENFVGTRIQYAGHPSSPPDQYRRVIRSEDAITGVRLDITTTGGQSSAQVVSYGNVNTGGQVQSWTATVVSSNDMIAFMGLDPSDGSVNLLTVFLRSGPRAIWTIHTDRIAHLDQMAVGKTFIGDCRVAKI